MRQKEFTDGVEIVDNMGTPLGKSKIVATQAIPQVIISRISMAAPYMGKNIYFNINGKNDIFTVLTPLAVNQLLKKRWFNSRPWLSPIFQTLFCGLILLISTPLCCAIFPQMSPIPLSKLEPELQEKVKQQSLRDPPEIVYYNKGL